MDRQIFIPFSRQLYDDIVRLSNGRMDPAYMAQQALEDMLALEAADQWADHWGENFEEAVELFVHGRRVDESKNDQDVGSLIERLVSEQQLKEQHPETKCLIWKELTIPAGTPVRMVYNEQTFFAAVQDGAIKDSDGDYSPSQWASKVARGTSRNAWRDIEFKDSKTGIWMLADEMRQRVRKRGARI